MDYLYSDVTVYNRNNNVTHKLNAYVLDDFKMFRKDLRNGKRHFEIDMDDIKFIKIIEQVYEEHSYINQDYEINDLEDLILVKTLTGNIRNDMLIHYFEKMMKEMWHTKDLSQFNKYMKHIGKIPHHHNLNKSDKIKCRLLLLLFMLKSSENLYDYKYVHQFYFDNIIFIQKLGCLKDIVIINYEQNLKQVKINIEKLDKQWDLLDLYFSIIDDNIISSLDIKFDLPINSSARFPHVYICSSTKK